jgi:uncharacterized membrane protein
MTNRPTAVHLLVIVAMLGTAVSCAKDEQAFSPLAPAIALQVDAPPAVGWTPIPLGLPSGSNRGWASAINNAGVAVGLAYVGGGLQEPFLWSAATGFRRLPTTPARADGVAHAINNEDVVVGVVFGGLSGQAAVWTSGGSHLDSIPGLDSALYSAAVDINDRGEIVGEAVLPSDPFSLVAFRFSPRRGLEFLPPLSGKDARVFALSANGLVVGLSGTSQFVGQPTIWSASNVPTALATMAGAYSVQPVSVNSKGVVVGWSYDGTSVFQPLVWPVPGRFEILRLPVGTTSALAGSIDELGRIYGSTTEQNSAVPIVWGPGGRPRILPQAPTTSDAVPHGSSGCGKLAGATTAVVRQQWMIWDRPC